MELLLEGYPVEPLFGGDSIFLGINNLSKYTSRIRIKNISIGSINAIHHYEELRGLWVTVTK